MTTQTPHEAAMPGATLSLRVTARPRADKSMSPDVYSQNCYNLRRSSEAIRAMMQYIDGFGNVEDYMYSIDVIPPMGETDEQHDLTQYDAERDQRETVEHDADVRRWEAEDRAWTSTW